MQLIMKNSLYIGTALALVVLGYLYMNWPTLPTITLVTGVFAIAITAHVWEEDRFPGGFVEMVTKHLHFTQKNPAFGSFITFVCVLFIIYVPLLFPQLTWIAGAPFVLGVGESIWHTVAGKIEKKDTGRLYSPGMFTAVTVLLPISIWGIWYIVTTQHMPWWGWLTSFLYMVFGLAMAQRIVVTQSGMSYSEFLANVRRATAGQS